jgi:hypothetical protein
MINDNDGSGRHIAVFLTDMSLDGYSSYANQCSDPLLCLLILLTGIYLLALGSFGLL